MAEQDKLCYSPNGGNLAYHSTDDNLIYKGAATPPTPPTPDPSVIITVSVTPSYIPGTPIEGYEQYYDCRMATDIGPSSWNIAPSSETVSIWSSSLPAEFTGDIEVGPYGVGVLYETQVYFTVEVSITQPSTGAQFNFQLQGSLGDNPPIHEARWLYTLYSNANGVLTNATIVPDWQ